jgi:hypothetical protein
LKKILGHECKVKKLFQCDQIVLIRIKVELPIFAA